VICGRRGGRERFLLHVHANESSKRQQEQRNCNDDRKL
jgi:hypothetical protein